jgi:hypothetical protein
VNVNLLPGSDNTKNLGSSTKSWKDIYLDGILYVGGIQFLSVPKFSNTCVGNYAGFSMSLTSGDGNTFVGYNSGYSISSGAYNSALGDAALKNNTTGWYNSAPAILHFISNTTGTRNSSMGSWSLHDNTDGDDNSAFGYNALYHMQMGIKIVQWVLTRLIQMFPVTVTQQPDTMRLTTTLLVIIIPLTAFRRLIPILQEFSIQLPEEMHCLKIR